jgi:hypothetical protein
MQMYGLMRFLSDRKCKNLPSVKFLADNRLITVMNGEADSGEGFMLFPLDDFTQSKKHVG